MKGVMPIDVDFLSDIFTTLNEARVRYLIAGGVAATLYGAPRLTFDVDIIIDFSDENVQRLCEAFAARGIRPRLPVNPHKLADAKQRRRWMTQKGMKVFSFHETDPPMRIIDIMVKPIDAFDAMYRRRKNVMAKRVRLPLVSKNDLLRMKRIARRPQDLEDIDFLTLKSRSRRSRK